MSKSHHLWDSRPRSKTHPGFSLGGGGEKGRGGDELFCKAQSQSQIDGEIAFPPAGLNSERLSCSLGQRVFSFGETS